MKMNGCIKLFRKEIKKEKELTDAELRLYLLLRRLADWDRRHEHFGSVKISLRQLYAEYLNMPSWSVTKISIVINGLIKKDLLKRLSNGYIAVENFRIFQARVPVAEQMFRLMEQGVQPTEQDVQSAEQASPDEINRRRRELAQKFKFP